MQQEAKIGEDNAPVVSDAEVAEFMKEIIFAALSEGIAPITELISRGNALYRDGAKLERVKTFAENGVVFSCGNPFCSHFHGKFVYNWSEYVVIESLEEPRRAKDFIVHVSQIDRLIGLLTKAKGAILSTNADRLAQENAMLVYNQEMGGDGEVFDQESFFSDEKLAEQFNEGFAALNEQHEFDSILFHSAFRDVVEGQKKQLAAVNGADEMPADDEIFTVGPDDVVSAEGAAEFIAGQPDEDESETIGEPTDLYENSDAPYEGGQGSEDIE